MPVLASAHSLVSECLPPLSAAFVVTLAPLQLPGDAWDPSVPGVQFWYDYIIPNHPNAIPQMKKLYSGGQRQHNLGSEDESVLEC
jgi:hypothetical protein